MKLVCCSLVFLGVKSCVRLRRDTRLAGLLRNVQSLELKTGAGDDHTLRTLAADDGAFARLGLDKLLDLGAMSV